MPTGLPDWTVPTAIVDHVIDRLAVDIAAQSIAQLDVHVAGYRKA